LSTTITTAANWGFLLDGEWLTEGEPFEVVSPYDGTVVGTTFWATAEHAETAVKAAQRAFETTRKMPGFERQRILREISEGIRVRQEEFARLIASEAGKPIRTARDEVNRAVFTFAIAAEEATRIGGEWLPLDWQASAAGRGAIVRRFALGPILAISPFNFPLNLVAHKVAPAIAAGCTIVLKPAPKTPLTSLLLAEVIAKSGWPKGAFNVLNLANPDAERLVTDDRLKMLSFTGSGPVGWALKAKSGRLGAGRQCRRYRAFGLARRRCGRPLCRRRVRVCGANLRLGAADFRSPRRGGKVCLEACGWRAKAENGRSPR
jgi:glyceraldehyde-3-phosphate dehydrogenase (NADP+)